jgi:hypothetical protein
MKKDFRRKKRRREKVNMLSVQKKNRGKYADKTFEE